MLLIFVIYQAWSTHDRTRALSPGGPSVRQYLHDTLPLDSGQRFTAFPFSSSWQADSFLQPPRVYFPWIRWEGLGDSLSPDLLTWQVQQWDSLHFGGIEVPSTTDKPAWRRTFKRFYFGSKRYTQQLIHLLDQASRRGLLVDLQLGPGSPPGGPDIQLADNVQSLFFSETQVLGGKTVRVPLPALATPPAYWHLAWQEPGNDQPQDDMLDFFPDSARLLCLLATKPVQGKHNLNPFVMDDQVVLNPDSVFLITDQVNEEGDVVWEAPRGYWKLIAVYAGPDGERPVNHHYAQPALTVNPLDSTRVVSHYQYLLRQESLLKPWLGKPLRALLQTQANYKAEHLFGENFLSYFAARRGYDLLPYLPVLAFPAQHNRWIGKQHWPRKAEYKVTDEDERIRYDYDLTLSELYEDHFLGASTHWGHRHALAQRAQTFGLSMDLLRAAAQVDIPEMSQAYAGGTELFLKLVSSGAHHYQKPLLSAACFGSASEVLSSTPQKQKIALDKLFGLGVNHLVFGNFSTQRSNPFVQHLLPLTEYASRCQYLLRKGQPEAEVLLYYPFLGFPETFADLASHEELYFRGQVPGWDALSSPQDFPVSPIIPHQKWLSKVYQLTQALAQAGISWEWVNDALLQEATFDQQSWQLQGRQFASVIVPDAPHIPRKTAEHLLDLSQLGAPLVLYGSAPDHQPGFWKHQENDPRIQEIMALLSLPQQPQTPLEMVNLLQELPTRNPYRYESSYPFLRHHQRRLDNGDRIIFYHNIEGDGRYFRIQIPDHVSHTYWLNPLHQTIAPVQASAAHNVLGYLEGFGSTFLLCTQTPLPDSLLSGALPLPQFMVQNRNRIEHPLQDWTLRLKGPGESVLQWQDSVWWDWRDHPELAHTAAEGAYSARFFVQDTLADIRYILDLGKVFHAADVYLNTQLVESVALLPFQVDLSRMIQPGWNQVEIWVTPTLYNAALQQAHNGKQANPELLSRNPKALQPAGMIGPVRLWEVLN